MPLATMTGRERVTRTMRGLLPDRVPFHPSLYFDHACVATGRRFEDFLIDPILGNRAMLDAAAFYGTDTVRFNLVPDSAWFQNKIVREHNGELVQYERHTGAAEGTFDVPGGGKFQPHPPEGSTPPEVRSIADVRAIAVPTAEEYLQRGCFAGVADCVRTAHDRGLFVIGFNTSQTLNYMVQQLGGPEPAMLCFYDDPALAHALIDKAVAISIERGKAWMSLGVDCIYIGDSYASGSVISPETYRTFCAPAYRTLAGEMHRLGALVYKHCCGFYDPLLADVPDTGIDAMDGIDPTTGMSVAHTKAMIGDRVTLMGGMSCLTLLQGTPAQVYDEARQCIASGKPAGRYILGSACAMPRYTPPANIRAARAAIDDFGVY